MLLAYSSRPLLACHFMVRMLPEAICAGIDIYDRDETPGQAGLEPGANLTRAAVAQHNRRLLALLQPNATGDMVDPSRVIVWGYGSGGSAALEALRHKLPPEVEAAGVKLLGAVALQPGTLIDGTGGGEGGAELEVPGPVRQGERRAALVLMNGQAIEGTGQFLEELDSFALQMKAASVEWELRVMDSSPDGQVLNMIGRLVEPDRRVQSAVRDVMVHLLAPPGRSIYDRQNEPLP